VIWSIARLKLAHVNDATNAVTRVHIVEGLVDSAKRLAVSDELIDLQLAGHVIINEVGKLGAALDATESAALPHTTSDKLECWKEVSTIREKCL
jgi:hypothetical protein